MSILGAKLSKVEIKKNKVTIRKIKDAKNIGKKLSMITCYDSSFAKIINHTPIDLILVGDSLGNVMLGYGDTIKVTMEDMIHHTAAVTRVNERAFVCADMPFLSYQLGIQESIKNAGQLIQKGGAQGVKLEGGNEVCEVVRAITQAGIPVMGHLGLTPQSIHSIGGYRVQGKDPLEKKKMIEDALALQEAGVFALVLEMVPKDLALEISELLKIPTIGIGAGPHCDGQVLVLQDLLGFDSGFNPKFLKKYVDMSSIVQNALQQYDEEVKSGVFPAIENSFI